MASRAFTLIETMVVIAIIGIIAAFAVPTVSSMVNSTRLSQASMTVSSQLSLARRYAMTRNHPVEVRFIRFQDPESPPDGSGASAQFRGIQLLEALESGVAVPLGKVELLPDAVVLASDTRSSILDGETATQLPRTPSPATDTKMPRGIDMNYTYVPFRYLPDGATNLAANHNWFVTVLAEKDQKAGTKLPANFYILQIDPVNGITREFRPNLG